MPMEPDHDFDDLIRMAEIEADPVHARRERQRALWAVADAAFRVDVSYSIAMAKAASAARAKVPPTAEEMAVRCEHGRQDHARTILAIKR